MRTAHQWPLLAKAAHDVLVSRFPAQDSALDTTYSTYLAANGLSEDDPGVDVGHSPVHASLHCEKMMEVFHRIQIHSWEARIQECGVQLHQVLHQDHFRGWEQLRHLRWRALISAILTLHLICQVVVTHRNTMKSKHWGLRQVLNAHRSRQIWPISGPITLLKSGLAFFVISPKQISIILAIVRDCLPSPIYRMLMLESAHGKANTTTSIGDRLPRFKKAIMMVTPIQSGIRHGYPC